jgi:hypothetical protein
VSSFVNPLRGKGSPGYAEALQRIRRWTAEKLLGGDAVVSVSELSCAEPGCPPRETIILIMWPDGQAWKARIHKAIPDVTQEEVVLSLQTPEHIGPQG